MDSHAADELVKILLPGKYDESPNKGRDLSNVQFKDASFLQ